MIAVEGLRFRYPGSENYAVDGVDFEVAPGEVFGLLGPSGVGKTTTQRILVGLMRSYEGSARVGGLEVRDAGADYYEQIGVAFEFPTLYGKFTALENLVFFASLYGGETEDPHKLLALVGLEDVAHTRVSSFSHGMKMRLRLCRAFINRPEIVFLDEPTAALDPVNARAVRSIITTQRETGATAVISTHDMVTADEVCDRVAFIVNGTITAVDSPRRLKMRRGRRTLRAEYIKDGQLKTRDLPLEGLGENEEFSRILRETRVETLHTYEPTLEDVFVEVTGRRLQ